MLVKVPVPLNWGSAEYDSAAMVEVGDRLIPQRIDVHFPGGGKQPSLDMVIEVVEGVPSCTSLAVSSGTGGREVRTSDLRLVRIEDWLVYVVAACSEEYEVRDETIHSMLTIGEPSTADRRAIEATRRRRGPRKIDASFLTKVAQIYRDHFDDRPNVAIARAYGVSDRTAAWYVQLCRSDEYQLLPKTDRKGKKKA
jgi:hypothetical protein